ncbi:MAG: RebB family R body protein [Acidobacteriota bacterium]|nr:RebB family R body protein [Acidobacteriota bacterium]
MSDNEAKDSVSQVNTKVLGSAPAMAMGNLYQAASQALGNAMQNATMSQQELNTIAQAATTMGVATLFGNESAASAPPLSFDDEDWDLEDWDLED